MEMDDAGREGSNTNVISNCEIKDLTICHAERLVIVNEGRSQSSIHSDSVEEGTPERKRQKLDLIRRFVELTNKRDARHRRAKNSSATYQEHDLWTPTEERNPQLWKHEFFEGASREMLVRITSTQSFSEVDKLHGKILKMEDIFSDGSRFTVIVGSPGSGKTTFLERYRKKVLEGCVPHLQDVELVHLISATELPRSQTTFSDLFFKNLVSKLSDQDIEYGIQWLDEEENQKKVLLIIDGLDRSGGWCLDTEDVSINLKSTASCSAIMYNLFSGHILPKVRILAATRRHGIQHYHSNVRPDTTVAMAGLTREDTRYLFQEMIGEESETTWENLTETVKSLCSTPLLLVYTLVIHKSLPYLPKETLSAIMMGIIENVKRQETNQHEDPNLISKLKHFCLCLMKINLISFKEADLSEFKIKINDIRNLSISIPDRMKHMVEKRILQEDVNLYFSHQVIQETLAAIGFLELPLANKEFENFLNDHLHLPHFSTVLQIACGILMNKATREIAPSLLQVVSDQAKKTEILCQSLKDRLGVKLDPIEELHLIAALHEAGEATYGVIKSSLHEIYLNMYGLTMCDMQTISPVIGACSSLRELNLCSCNIDDKKLEILWLYVDKSCELRIHSFILGLNNIGVNGIGYIGKIVVRCQIQELDLHWCGLTKQHMDELFKQLENAENIELKCLYLPRNESLGVEGMKAVWKIVRKANIKKLDISSCGITAKHLRGLDEYVHGLQKLLIGKNEKLGVEGMAALAYLLLNRITTETIVELHLNWCELTLKHLQVFAEELAKPSTIDKSIKILGLNISNNKHISDADSCEILIKIAKAFDVRRMDIHGCDSKVEVIRATESSTEEKEKIMTTLKRSLPDVHFERIDAYISMELGTENFITFLQQNRGRYVDVSLTKTSQQNLRELPQLIESYNVKFRKLCLSEGKKATREDIKQFLKLLPHISEEFWIGEWDVDEDCRKSMQVGINALESDATKLTIHFSLTDTMRVSQM